MVRDEDKSYPVATGAAAWMVPAVAIGLPCLTLLAVLLKIPFPEYADQNFITSLTDKGQTLSRWLASVKLTGWAFQITKSPFLKGLGIQVESFVRVANSAVMGISLLWAWQRFPKFRYPIFFIGTSGTWLFLGTGYLKVYSWASAVALVYWSVLFSSVTKKSTEIQLGLLAALPFIFYTGLIVLGPVVLMALFLYRPSKALFTALLVVLFSFVAVKVFWDGQPQSFWSNLWVDINAGERNTAYLPYHGKASGQDSIFFKLSFAFSLKNFLDKTYMVFFNGGFLPAAWMLYLLTRNRKLLKSQCQRLKFFGDQQSPQVFALVTLVFATLLYTVHLIMFLPKFEPRIDMPIFHQFSLCSCVMLGKIVDTYGIPEKIKKLFWVSWSVYSVAIWILATGMFLPRI